MLLDNGAYCASQVSAAPRRQRWVRLEKLPVEVTVDVAQWLESEFKFRDPGFDPLARQSEEQFFLFGSTFVQTCLCLTPFFVCMARIQSCAHVKDPVFICRKRVGLSRWYENKLISHRGEKPWYCLTIAARFPQGKQPEFPNALG